MVVDRIWRICSIAFEGGLVLEDWRSAGTVPLKKCKREMTGCKNYKGINFLSVVGKIYPGI